MRKTVLSCCLAALFAALPMTLPAAPSHSVAVADGTHGQSVQVAPVKLNLNEADAIGLQAGLSGIGRTKAEAIVAYREANGPFASVDELLEIKGIGKTLLDRNRERLTVE
ncbi:ComEA family DNA-binding protein [Pseudomonas japonica]|uniref:ComEA family DNA-binding protein n=1 Tax=Pseudomonas TaxID=286 RepID=UPI00292878DC|nr:helix-hairpin-helix domain-containing protein [Pseudomonas sp. zfem002]MDU9390842.1 helix-hairpin-helix domain-containing protein [Pseudomonas sp. zfem002]